MRAADEVSLSYITSAAPVDVLHSDAFEEKSHDGHELHLQLCPPTTNSSSFILLCLFTCEDNKRAPPNIIVYIPAPCSLNEDV